MVPCIDVSDFTSMPTEMDRFSDEELTAIYDDPNAGGVLRRTISPVLSMRRVSDSERAAAARDLVAASFPDADPLFIDDLFVAAFLSNWQHRMNLSECLSTVSPETFLSSPAFQLVAYDRAVEHDICSPTAQWISASERAGRSGVILGSSVMIARFDSPVWDELGIRGDNPDGPLPFTFDRMDRFTWRLQSVSRREFVKLCSSCGIPDPEDDIRSAAKRIKHLRPKRRPKFTPEFTLRDEANDLLDSAFATLSSRRAGAGDLQAFQQKNIW